jgi:hypothetical protein
MAQLCTVIQGDPWTLKDQLIALAGNIQVVEKTTSAGKFIVIYDTVPLAQNFTLISGDPQKLSSEINAIIAGGSLIDLIIPTFSSSHYLVVSQ